MRMPNANKLLALVIGAISVLAIFVVLTANQETKQLDPGTPEGVVQKYLSSVIAGDFESALKNLEPTSKCEPEDLDRSYFPQDIRVNLISSTNTSTGAIVKISLEFPTGGPLGDVYTEEHTIRLVQSGSTWFITGIPWPMYDCGGLVK